MTDLVFDGFTKASWVPMIADIAAPSVGTELNAAGSVSLEDLLTPDGLKISTTTANVDTSSLASTFTTGRWGRRSYDILLTAKRRDVVADDKAYTTLVYNAAGFLVVRRTVVATTAYAVGDLLAVYPAICGGRNYATPTANEVQKFEVGLMVTSPPNEDATAVA